VKRIGLIILLGILALLATLLIRTGTMKTATLTKIKPRALVPLGAEARLSRSITFKTISRGENSEAFKSMFTWMKQTWPDFFRLTTLERFKEHSLLITWQGKDTTLAPIMFLAHQDVVPIEAGTEAGWLYPPFSGQIAPCGDEPGNCVWGRGAIDMKAALVALIEAANTLASSGWQPDRTILFGLGHDEEVGGRGAQAIARHLKAKNLRPIWLLDEGLLVTEGLTPGIDQPIAYIGIAEKGYASLQLTVEQDGGHASMPPASTAVGRLARAITRLEDNPFPAALGTLGRSMLAEVAPHMSFTNRLAMANLWLLESLVVSKLAKKPSTNAIVRTTQAATMFEGSPQDNILPKIAKAVVNYRIHPRDSVGRVVQRVTNVIADANVRVALLKGGLLSEPSRVSSVEGPGFDVIRRSILRVFGEIIVAPGLFIAATDSRHYAKVADQIYRFHPIRLRTTDRMRIHGTNERIRVENFRETVTFYGEVIKRGSRR
jgi:carboxypeptidase PM20D1